MMERADTAGWGVAFVGHVALVAALAWAMAQQGALPSLPPSMEVSFEEEIGPISSAPMSEAPPAPSLGEEIGTPEEASGATASVAEEAPPAPAPVPQPTETGDRRRPDVTRNAVPVRPQAQAQRPQPQPQPQRPQPQRAQQQPQRAQPQRPTRPQQAQPQRPGNQAARGNRSAGFNPDALRRSLGPGEPSAQGTSRRAQGAVVTNEVRASLDQAILRALLPCQRQTLPAPDAREIRVRVAVTLNQDGSLAGARVLGVNSYDGNLRQYEPRMRELALRVVQQCTPIRGLPPEYYSVSRGWRQFNYTFPRS
jgi:outer membrane biosynthesis protein TonB